jgi:hypothetical protein
MISVTPGKLLLIAFSLMVIGAVLPFLMVLKIVESTLFLNFFSFTAQMLGMILGFIGVSQYVVTHRRK